MLRWYSFLSANSCKVTPFSLYTRNGVGKRGGGGSGGLPFKNDGGSRRVKICRLVPFRMLRSKIATVRIIAVEF